MTTTKRLNIAIIGTGISGMSAAWLLSQNHDVMVYEQATRIGGHSHTVQGSAPGGEIPVDTGFIVYNDVNYPNLVALFDHLGVPTQISDMSFAVSLEDGALEYAGSNPGQLFAQKKNLLRPRFWAMLRDLRRFYRKAPRFLDEPDDDIMTLGAYLDANGFGAAFQQDHLLPMAAAVWSTPAGLVRDYPAKAFIRFCDNHGLLRIGNRPQWRTVTGGSRAYVSRLTARYADKIRLATAATEITRIPDGVLIRGSTGDVQTFDHAVIAAHADQALRMLSDPTPQETEILGAFGYQPNLTVLHSDAGLMPKRRSVWSSWNYLGGASDNALCVTYWMNRLQNIPNETPLFVTLNPIRNPKPGSVIKTEMYEHPQFNAAAIRAQGKLWSLQGRGNTWFAGAYFGSGFHEDGLQAGLAVAEALGGVKRPWTVADESGRIRITR
jgi:predicted NAD/FAD-binding protein